LSLDDALEWLDVERQYFIINAQNNVLKLKYDSGSTTSVTLTDGTYEGSTLASHIQTVMNSTLTMSGTVAFSSTTYMFTLSAGAGHTLTYTHSGSDAGLLIGFTADKSAALTLTSDVACGDPTGIVQTIITHCEKWFQSKCNRTFESTTYTNEKYSGDGGIYLFLKQYPVTAVTRASIGTRSVIRINNTSSYTTASVSVSSSSVSLELNGSASEVDFTTYTTIGDVVTQINTLGNGWYAEVTSSTYNSFASTQLITVYGFTCIESSWVNLSIPERGLGAFEVHEDGGMIELTGGFPKGSHNIYVTYTAGYSSATMPEDIKMAIKILVKYIYQRRIEESFGLQSYSLGGVSQTLEQTELPKQVFDIINYYRKYTVI